MSEQLKSICPPNVYGLIMHFQSIISLMATPHLIPALSSIIVLKASPTVRAGRADLLPADISDNGDSGLPPQAVFP